jgi:kinesin family member 18/19
MIVNISPFSANWEDSHNSLLYASRAKNIKNYATRNTLASEANVSNYIALIGNLKKENDDLKKQLKGSSISFIIQKTNLCLN